VELRIIHGAVTLKKLPDPSSNYTLDENDFGRAKK
jgi:hypothetical protein